MNRFLAPLQLLKFRLLLVAFTWLPVHANAQIKAFPQAEGFGALANGGRGGDVYHVTKLNDDGSVGTLRHAIESAPNSAGRTIVFDVGGWITLNSKLGIVKEKRNITIAGQTAPGGIGVRGGQFSVGGDDIIVRHMRFRPGKDSGRNDSVNTNSDAQRVIYDHISAGFSYDENFSVQATDVTLQYSTVSHGLQDHSAGSLLENPHRLTMHHNLYAHNNTRNPKHRVQETLDWVNNVIYNWDERAFFMQGTSSTGYFWTSNIDGNYFIAGPNHGGTKPLSGGSLDDYGTWWGTNAFDGDGDGVHDGRDYAFGDRAFGDVSSALTTWSDTPYPVANEVWKDASTQAAYERVLSEFGATPWDRDEVDQLLYSNVVNRNGSIISHENQLVAHGVSNAGFGTLGGVAPPADIDRDGMPDAWEIKHGTNPNVPNNNGDFDYDGYTDLEEYLNDLAAFKAVGPLEFSGIGRYADWQRWTRRWEPSRLDDVHINDGAAFVDAVGQKAGTLHVGHDSNSGGRLYVTSGWLEVTDDLLVGTQGTGRVEQHGGEVRVVHGGVQLVDGTYRLLGGVLTTPQLSKHANADFQFSGGTLSTAQVAFDLENNGGTLAAELGGVGSMDINGDLSLTAGGLAVDIASATLADLYQVDGQVTLGGSLDVSLLDGFLPTAGQSWEFLTAASITGDFAAVTAGFSVQQIGNSLWLTTGMGAAATAIPEPSALALLTVALTVVVVGRRKAAVASILLLGLAMLSPLTAQAVTVSAIADTQLSENGTTGIGDATDAGSGTTSPLNARWNFSSDPANRNEWIAMKFDLGDFSQKSFIDDVALRVYMHRANANNSQTLRLYALTPGIAGEDWNEQAVTYGSMPGFTFDGFSNTNLLDVGGAIQDLGSFAVSGFEAEGSLALINPASLTSFVSGMGDNDLLTLLVTYEVPSNGQWRILSREGTSSDTGVLSGSPGDFAPFLDFDYNVPTSGVRGDYNNNGVVDLGDYTLWRDTLGGSALVNEEVSPTTVDVADYLYWRERFGATDSGGPALAATYQQVPEPAAMALVLALTAANLSLLRMPNTRFYGRMNFAEVR